MSGSVAVAVRSAVTSGLDDAFGALAEFNGEARGERKVHTTYAFDRRSNAAEQVFTARSRADTPSSALRSGRNYRDEAGEFDLFIVVGFVGGSEEDADTRAFAIGEVVEEWLGDRKSNELGVTGLQTLTVRGWESQNLLADRGAATELIYRVAWTARIT